MTKTLRPVRPPRPASERFSHASGRASAMPSRNTTRHRVASNTHCSNRRRRRFFFIARSRKSIAAHVTVLNRRRLRMWMMIGIETAASPAQKKAQVTKPIASTAETPNAIRSSNRLFNAGGPGRKEAAERHVQRVAAVHPYEVYVHPAAEL